MEGNELKLSVFALNTSLMQRWRAGIGSNVLKFPKAAVPKNNGISDRDKDHGCAVVIPLAGLSVKDERANNDQHVHARHVPVRCVPMFGHVARASG
jgi:hypothetical protein